MINIDNVFESIKDKINNDYISKENKYSKAKDDHFHLMSEILLYKKQAECLVPEYLHNAEEKIKQSVNSGQNYALLSVRQNNLYIQEFLMINLIPLFILSGFDCRHYDMDTLSISWGNYVK